MTRVTGEWLAKLAHPMTDYPEGDKLIDVLLEQVTGEARPRHLLEMIAKVLAGVARADVMGLIHTGDEHEWARLSIAALDRSLVADVCPSHLTNDIRCQIKESQHTHSPGHHWTGNVYGVIRHLNWHDE